MRGRQKKGLHLHWMDHFLKLNTYLIIKKNPIKNQQCTDTTVAQDDTSLLHAEHRHYSEGVNLSVAESGPLFFNALFISS